MIELVTETAIQEPQRIRGLEMPWNRVMGTTEGPAGAARALGPCIRRSSWPNVSRPFPRRAA